MTLSCGSNASGIPAGDMGTLFVLPEEFRPAITVRMITFPTSNIQITIDALGNVTAYNYGDAVSGNTAARFTMTYIAAS